MYELYIEIELNHKTGTKLNKWLFPRIKRLNKSDSNSELRIYTPFQGVIDSYSEALTKKVYGVTNSGGYDYIDKNRYQTLSSKKIVLCKLVSDPTRRSGGGFKINTDAMWARPSYIDPNTPPEEEELI